MVKRSHLLAALLLCILARPAFAATTTGVATIRMTIPSSCDIRSGDQVALDFGSSLSLASNIDATGTIKLLCSTNVSWSVYASNGANFVSPDRRMKNTASNSFLRYGIYSNSARSTAFPVVAGSNVTAGTGAMQDVPVYGRIFGGQTVDFGDYTDTLLITLTW